MTRVVAYPDDRQRLLANGEMRMPVYSRNDPADVALDSYRTMTDAADLMALALSEPIVEAGPADCFGGRIVTTRCGCWDDP
jgi:hypothetical protein